MCLSKADALRFCWTLPPSYTQGCGGGGEAGDSQCTAAILLYYGGRLYLAACSPPNRDVEAEEKQETPWAQQEQFEAEQIKKAASKYGAKDRKSKAGG